MRVIQAPLRRDCPTQNQDQTANRRPAWVRDLFYTPARWPRLAGRLETAALVLALCFTVGFVVLAIARMLYPFEIGWSESAIFSMAVRRMQGESTYMSPSLFDGASCLYPPLFFDLSALIARALPIGHEQVSFLSMRLLSVVSCLSVQVAMVWLLRRKKGLSWRMAMVLAAILPATYGRMDFWYDNARVDNLFLLFLFTSTAILLEGKSLWSAALAGILGGLATLTKQPALLLLGLAGLPTVFVKRQLTRAAVFALAFACTVVRYLYFTGDLINPDFLFWVFKVPASHPFLWRNVVLGPLFLAVVLPFLVFFAALPVVLRLKNRTGEAAAKPTLDGSWSLVFVLWTVLSLLLRGKDGASVNYFMPLIPVGIIALSEAFACVAARGLDGRRVAALSALAQLSLLVYDPTLFIPSKQAAAEASALVAVLEKVDGPVWFPAYPSYAALAGKPWMTHYGTLTDLEGTYPGYVAADLSQLINERFFGAIVLPPGDHFVSRDELEKFYEEQALPEVHSPFLRRVHHVHVGGSLFLRRK